MNLKSKRNLSRLSAVPRTLRNQSASPSSAFKMYASTENETPWERVLWKYQTFPDNYVPGSFNPALKRNGVALQVHFA